MPSLIDGMEDIFHLCDDIGANTAIRTGLIEALKPLVPEASDPHGALYGMTVRWSTTGHRLSHPLGPASDGDDPGTRDLDQTERQHEIDEALDLLRGAGDLEHE